MCNENLLVRLFSGAASERGRFCACAAVFALLAFAAKPVYAQAITGVIVGTVHDASGGTVAGVKITAKNVATGAVLEALTGAEGNYTFPNVTPGIYDVSAQKAGFTTSVASNTTIE